MPESEVEFSNDASTLQLIIYSPAATDKSHYENVSFEIPESWVWTTLGEISNYGQCENVSNDEHVIQCNSASIIISVKSL